MTKRRTLLDLFVQGTEATIDDGGGGVTVWLQKLNPLEHETVVRKAAGARARMLAFQNDPESEDYQLAMGDALDFGEREALIDFLTMDELAERHMSIEARLSMEEDSEWAEDSYLQGLYDAWSDELEDRYALDKDDPEAVRVLSELKRFNDLVQKELMQEREQIHRDFEGEDVKDLLNKATAKFLKRRADQEFLAEYQLYELFLAVRRPEDHKTRYFESRKDLDLLAPAVRDFLQEQFVKITVEPVEGKGSEATPDSSHSSEASVPAGEGPSGPTDAPQ